MTRRLPVELEAVTSVRDELGEGPVWLPVERRLMWVDITRHLIHRLDPRTGDHSTIDVGLEVGAVAPADGGDVVAAVKGGFALVSTRDGGVVTLATVEKDRPGNRMNDGKCDARGRFWAGSMAYDLTPSSGALYRLDPNLIANRMLSPVTLSNGLGWSPDNKTMYYIDSVLQRIDAFDFDLDSGRMAKRRVTVELAPSAGMPDGMTIDADGCIWVALWGGGAVHRYTPKGRLDAVVQIPAALVTSCTFGGEELKDLYVTTATIDLGLNELENQPEAGFLFRCRPGASGLPGHVFHHRSLSQPIQ